MKRQHIKFAAQWDKLKQPRFTTIRTFRLDKRFFYESHVGETFTILKVPHEFAPPRKGYKIGEATLLRVETVVPRNLDPALLMDDVRMNGVPDGRWMEKLLGMNEALLLTFENHTGLLGS